MPAPPHVPARDHADRAAPASRARYSRRRRGHHVVMRMNIAPMIDMTFLLLIFFLVTTRFTQPEGLLTSRMPEDRGEAGVPLPISPIIVRVRQTGPALEDYAILIDNIDAVPSNFDDLSRFLREIQARPGFDEIAPVVIVPGQDVWWDHVVNAWNAALRAGCRNIAFGAE